VVLEPSRGVHPDLPPDKMLLGEAAAFIVQYLQRYGPVRGAFQVDRGGDNAPVPSPSMPGYIHLALSQVAAHPAMPYAGNASALIRDLIYLGLGALTHTLAQYDTQDDGLKFSAHVIRREETFRRDLMLQLLGFMQVYDLVAAAQTARMYIDSGDAPAVFSLIQRVFHHLEQMPGNAWRYQLLRLIYGTPELRDAVVWLGQQDSHRHNQEVAAWSLQLGTIAEQMQPKTEDEPTTNTEDTPA
jgi:hypothetical protein